MSDAGIVSIKGLRPIQASDLLRLLAEHKVLPLVPPIDVDAACRALGIGVVETARRDKPIDVVGTIESDGQGTTSVWLNPSENQFGRRRRFTLAHELGHFCLHLTDGVRQEIVDAGQQFSRSTSYWTPVEAEANRFAAEFLMPAGLLARAASALIKARKERRHTVASQDLIESLSDYFEVSQKTMKYRLENLGVLTEA